MQIVQFWPNSGVFLVGDFSSNRFACRQVRRVTLIFAYRLGRRFAGSPEALLRNLRVDAKWRKRHFVSLLIEQFKKRLKRWRLENGNLRQKEAADKLSVSVSTIRKWESGKRTPNKLALLELERRMTP